MYSRYSNECPVIEVDTSLGGHRVVSVLEELSEIKGLPEDIPINGSQFAIKSIDECAYRRDGVKLNIIRQGKPIENA